MFLVIILVAQLPTKRGVLVHKNSLASCQWCCHSVEPRALMCPFNQFKLRASSLSSWVTPSHDWDYTAALLLNVCCLFVCLFFKWFRLKSAQSCQVRFFAFIHQGACVPCSLWNWIGVVQFLTQEVWYDKGLVIQHFLHYCLVQIVLLWSLSVGVRIFFTTNDLVDRIRNLKLNASQNDLKNIMKKMRRRPDFLKTIWFYPKPYCACVRERVCVCVRGGERFQHLKLALSNIRQLSSSAQVEIQTFTLFHSLIHAHAHAQFLSHTHAHTLFLSFSLTPLPLR